MEISAQSCIRERRSQARYSIAGCAASVHPIGHPIIISKKRGLEISSPTEEPLPNLKLTRSRCEEWGISTGRHPSARRIVHKFVQLRAAFESENCPQLVRAMSKGDTGCTPVPPIIKSGR